MREKTRRLFGNKINSIFKVSFWFYEVNDKKSDKLLK